VIFVIQSTPFIFLKKIFCCIYYLKCFPYVWLGQQLLSETCTYYIQTKFIKAALYDIPMFI